MRGTTRVASARPSQMPSSSSSSTTTTATITFVAIAIVASFCLVNVTLMARLVEDGRSSHRPDIDANDDGGASNVPMTTARGRRQRVARGRNDTTPHDEDDDPVLAHFRRAGLDLDDASRSRLPSWSYVESQYGKDVVIIGLDRCEYFRNNVPPLRRMLGSAGMFNSGTNLVTRLMKENCVIPERYDKYGPKATKEQYGIRWQCPWGKHTPAQFRHDHLAPKNENQTADDCLPVVTVRNPFTWMSSMCRIPYSAFWERSDPGTNGKGVCPHLAYADGLHRAATDTTGVTRTSPVGLEYKFSGHTLSYDSLAHLWNEWYAGYWRDADFPFLMVRLEDLVFRQYEATKIICDCAGGTVPSSDDFRYIVHSAKTGPAHGKVSERTDMVDAWAKYGKPMPIKAGFSDLDYDAAVEYLSRELMDMMGYKYPPSE